MLDSMGKRLQCCRICADLSSQDVINYVNNEGGEISATTYSKWEKDKSSPKKKLEELEIVIDLFKKRGIRVESSWVINGIGIPPKILSYNSVDDIDIFKDAFDHISLEREWIFTQISGNYAEPFLSIGEFAFLSEEEEIDNLNGKLARIKIGERNIYGKVEILDKSSISITSKKDIIINKSNITESRAVKWIRKN